LTSSAEWRTGGARWQADRAPPARPFYQLGGIAALLIAVLLIGEIVVYATFPRPASALEHFALFQDNRLAGLLTLDLLGMIAYLLFVPMILALYLALRRTNAAIMAVAAVLFFVGITVFFSTNPAFAVLTLSNQHAAATTEAERALYLAAGQALFTLFNENAFLVSYMIVSAAWAMIGGVMLRSSLFGRVTAHAGILAGVAGILAVMLEHILPSAALPVAIAVYFAAIAFLFLWVVLAGWRLYRLGTPGEAVGP
jgi:hypothetical protein